MFDVAGLRDQFPALSLKRSGLTPIFLDGPAGTQVPQRVIERGPHYLIATATPTTAASSPPASESDAMLDRAHQAVADFLNAAVARRDRLRPEHDDADVRTSAGRSAKTWKPGDEVMVTRLDHDANVSPWVLAARDAGATVRWIDIASRDCTLDLDTFRRKLSDRTKLVAVGLASNGVGTIQRRGGDRTARRKRAGALVVPRRGPLRAARADRRPRARAATSSLAPRTSSSARTSASCGAGASCWNRWPRTRCGPRPNALPGKWMTGTQNHEGIAGTLAAVEYLRTIGMSAIREYEQTLARRLLDGLAARPRFRVHGLGVDRLDERVPTIAITDRHVKPRQIAEHLAGYEIYVWSGNNYALELSEWLGREPDGFVRLGLVHYNTAAEVDALLEALDRLPT